MDSRHRPIPASAMVDKGGGHYNNSQYASTLFNLREREVAQQAPGAEALALKEVNDLKSILPQLID